LQVSPPLPEVFVTGDEAARLQTLPKELASQWIVRNDTVPFDQISSVTNGTSHSNYHHLDKGRPESLTVDRINHGKTLSANGGMLQPIAEYQRRGTENVT
jgi:hypothetical protein